MSFMELTCQLHMHTTESKGTRVVVESITRPKQAIDFCKKNKIDVLAVTDHNTTSAYPKMRNYAEKNGVLLMKGIEIDTADGHIIGLDVDLDIEKKINRTMTVLEAKDVIKDCGGEVLIPHPFDIRNKGIGTKITEVDGIVEVFNAFNIFKFEDRYADFVATKLKKPKSVGADSHMPESLNLCLTVVDSEPNVKSILKTIKKGEVKFENCRHLTLKEMKGISLERITKSYDYIKGEVKSGWEVDMKYMLLANNPMMRLIEDFVLEVGMKTKDSIIWDFVLYFSYFLAFLYGRKSKNEYAKFISSL